MSLHEYSTPRLQEELNRRRRLSEEAEAESSLPRPPVPPSLARPTPDLRNPGDPWMQEQISRFTQDGNTIVSTASTELLEITMQAVAGGGDFFVLQTKTGWSFDEIDDLVSLLKKAARTMRAKPPSEADRHIDMT